MRATAVAVQRVPLEDKTGCCLAWQSSPEHPEDRPGAEPGGFAEAQGMEAAPGASWCALAARAAVLLRGPRLAWHTRTSRSLPAQDAMAHAPLLREREPGECRPG